MKKLEKTEKRLQLHYDYCKTWLITCLGFLLASIIGYWTVEKEIAKKSLAVFIFVTTVAVIFFLIFNFRLFDKLEKIYK